MKKIFKILICLIKILLIIILLAFIFLYLNNKIQLKNESKKIIPYGQEVKVDNKSMRVQVVGAGKETLVLLPGYLTGSPVLDFKPLVNELSKNYKVVVVEPFGYGLSDDVEKIRSIENLTSELHEALEELNIKNYHLVGHSISGVYSLYYINKYPNEVQSFIGIDSSLPTQGGADDNQGNVIKLLSKSGLYRLFANVDSNFLNPPKLSDEELEQFKYISLKNIGNNATINEGEVMQENFDKVINSYYPEKLPVLYLLSSESVEEDNNWVLIHKDMLNDSKKSKIEILEGNHYLHHTKSVEMAKIIKEFLHN